MSYLPESMERQRALANAYRATWPELYATVQDAMALGFVPDAYGLGPEGHGGLQPPAKFHYPRAWVDAPFHVNGVGAGAAVCLFHHQEGSPDDLREQPVWTACFEAPYRYQWLAWLDNSQRSRWGITFDEGMAWAVALGDRIRQDFIVPEIHPVTRAPELTWGEWQEVAAVTLRGAQPVEPRQLGMFDDPAPVPESHQERTLANLRQVVAKHQFAPEARFSIHNQSYWIYDLIERANELRWDQMRLAVAS